ncbi:DUF6191 domain-containing protein [Streptomyces sp. NPDC060209]|uniref:DUF6191 domain-containing protein n=1 Tax=Streptomyces sp. NPDC060209 TaxID=3347073 RepID=UPI003649A649
MSEGAQQVFNFFEELFAPGRKHTVEEQKRLDLSRTDVGTGDPARGPIDLASGKVTLRSPSPGAGRPGGTDPGDDRTDRTTSESSPPDGDRPEGTPAEDCQQDRDRPGDDKEDRDRPEGGRARPDSSGPGS